MHSHDLGITNKRAQGPLQIPDAMLETHLHLPVGQTDWEVSPWYELGLFFAWVAQ
jgi:hypothetical protein